MPPTLARNFSFHLMWICTFLGGMGDRLMMLSAYQLLDIEQAGGARASVIAGVDFFFFLPYVVWSPLAGWLADRLPRKWVMVTSDFVRGGAVLAAWAMAAGKLAAPGDEVMNFWTYILI